MPHTCAITDYKAVSVALPVCASECVPPRHNTHSLTHTHTHTLRPRLFKPPRFGTHPYPSTSPSCEGLECIKAVVEESKKYGVTVHRVSQGSGINMMPRAETIDMLRVGRDNQLEVKCVCLCVCVCVCVWL